MTILTLTTLLPIILQIFGCTNALTFEAHRFPQHPLETRQGISINGSDYPLEWMSIPVDHFNASNTRTYSNRYWVNSKFYERNGPIFWFDAGEQNAQPLVPYFLDEVAGPSVVMTMARRFSGLAVIVKHRFYGGLDEGSYPYPINQTTGDLLDYDGYAVLNTEQALEDTVYLATHFQPLGLEDYWPIFTPNTTPWVWLGGNYSGIRGAQLRVRNPETFYAIWASSAPTEAAVNMWTYYAQAERSMTRNCSADFTAIAHYIDSVLTNGTDAEISQLKIEISTTIQASPSNRNPTINATEAVMISAADVGSLVQTPLAFYQYYGFERSVLPFCDLLETQNRTEMSTTDNGGNITLTWESFLTALVEVDYDSLVPPTPPDPVGGYSWTWQYCSEYGYYQVGTSSNPHTIESISISLDCFQAGCNATFPSLVENGSLPPTPNVSASNKYGGWNIRPSNTLFTCGQFDPWRALSPASIEEGSPQRRSVQTIPPCNQQPEGNDIFGLVYSGMVHVSDMRALLNESDYYHQNFSTVGFSSSINVEPFYAGTSLFERALEIWLPCFNASQPGQ